MTYTQRIRHGFLLASRNWQLVIVQVVVVLLNILGFLVFVLLPVRVLAVALGVDAERSGDIMQFLDAATSGAALSQYLGAVLVILLCLFVYVTFVLVLWLLVTGGTIGSLAHACRDEGARFSMGVFWAEAKKLFAPLAWYYTILSVAVIALFVVMAAAFGAGALGYEAAGLGESRLGIFFTVMGVLLLGSCGLFFSLCLYVLSVQGLCPLAVEGRGAMDSIKTAWRFLEKDRKSLYLILIVVGGYVSIEILLAFMGGMLQLIPLLGIFFYLPYSIVANIFGIYLYMAVLAAIISHYTEAVLPDATLIAGPLGSGDSGSSPHRDTSTPGASWQVPPPLYPEPPEPPQH